jgi:TfoX/Sxy family transcriptional regulator of competence genes
MAFDSHLGDRVRLVLERKKGIAERRMFGGLAFLISGKMFCGIIKNKLVVRVGPDQYHDALSKPHTSKMDFTGKPLTGYVYVGKQGVRTDNALASWIDQGLRFTKSLITK